MTDDYDVSEVSLASPDMSDKEMDALVDDIRKHGQLVPIWVSAGMVIDGRKRLAACKSLGLEPKVIEIGNNSTPEGAAYSLNILRTHYTRGQRAIFAARLAVRLRGQTRSANTTDLPTAAELASDAGVVESYIHTAKRVLRDGSPDLIASVESGRLSITAAEAIARRIPKEHQGPITAQTIASSTRGRSQTAKILGTWDGKRKQPVKPFPARIDKALSTLETVVSVLEGLFEEKHEGWVVADKAMRDCRARLSRMINQTEVAS